MDVCWEIICHLSWLPLTLNNLRSHCSYFEYLILEGTYCYLLADAHQRIYDYSFNCTKSLWKVPGSHMCQLCAREM